MSNFGQALSQTFLEGINIWNGRSNERNCHPKHSWALGDHLTSTPRALASIPRTLKTSNNEDISTWNQELIFSKIRDIYPCPRMKWKQRLYLGVEPAASFKTVTTVRSPGPPAHFTNPADLETNGLPNHTSISPSTAWVKYWHIYVHKDHHHI